MYTVVKRKRDYVVVYPFSDGKPLIRTPHKRYAEDFCTMMNANVHISDLIKSHEDLEKLKSILNP